MNPKFLATGNNQLRGGCSLRVQHRGFSPRKTLGVPVTPAPSSSSWAFPFLPAQGPGHSGMLGHLEPPLPSYPSWGGGSCTQGLGHHLISENGFQAKRRDKRPSVHPSVPSPSFPEQHSFMPACPPPAAPAPQHTASFHRLCGQLVCLLCRVQAFCCLLLFSPPRAASKQTLSGGTASGAPRRAGG